MQNLCKKILTFTVVGAFQIFQFSRQITWFLGNARALSISKYWILHHLINIIKLQNVRKPQFYVKHASHLQDIIFLLHTKQTDSKT